jgi:2-phosphoglycerate kinase
MTAASIRRHLKVTEKTAHAINNGQLIDFDDIRHVVSKVIPGKEISKLKSQWVLAWDRLGT